MRMWLVQCGGRKDCNFKGLIGKNGLVKLDFPAVSEFEDEEPYAYGRIMEQFSDYVFHKTNLTNINNCPLWIYVRKDKVEDVENCIKRYARWNYSLRVDRFNLVYQFSNMFNNITCARSLLFDDFYLETNFWWDIQNDWIAFVGADDVKEQYNMAINYDYRNWWLAKPEEERKSELEAAYARR